MLLLYKLKQYDRMTHLELFFTPVLLCQKVLYIQGSPSLTLPSAGP